AHAQARCPRPQRPERCSPWSVGPRQCVFFQAEDGIRDTSVTGVQTCALPIYRASVVASVNQEFAGWNAPLRGGDEVAFLPPVSGGQRAAVSEDVFELVREPIRTAELFPHVKAPEDGAVVVFDGIV